MQKLIQRILNWLRPMDKASICKRLDQSLIEWLETNGYHRVGPVKKLQGLTGLWQLNDRIAQGPAILNQVIAYNQQSVETKQASLLALRNTVGMAMEGRRKD